MMPSQTEKPRIVFLHYTAPSIVGGVEEVITQQVHLFREAGYPTLVVAGRSAEGEAPGPGVVIIPEMDSESHEVLGIQNALAGSTLPDDFARLRSTIQGALLAVLQPTDIVIAHNLLTMHFNLALAAALHELLDQRKLDRMIAWTHDISHYVDPDREAVKEHAYPWDLLRKYRSDITYVAVSAHRQRALAGILACSPEQIHVIPNGVDPVQLLGLSALGGHLTEEFGLFSVDLVILMPVRITRAKNLEFAFEIMSHLKRQGRTLRLVVSGPPDPHVPDINEYYRSLLDLRSKLSLQEEVVFVHEGTARYPSPLIIKSAVVGELYRLADLVLMPSRREGFGMPVLEAGLVGRPIFATSIPVLEGFPDFPYLIKPDESPRSVAQRIGDWADSDEAYLLRRRIRRDYTWAAIFSGQILPLINSTGISPGLAP